MRTAVGEGTPSTHREKMPRRLGCKRARAVRRCVRMRQSAALQARVRGLAPPRCSCIGHERHSAAEAETKHRYSCCRCRCCCCPAHPRSEQCAGAGGAARRKVSPARRHSPSRHSDPQHEPQRHLHARASHAIARRHSHHHHHLLCCCCHSHLLHRRCLCSRVDRRSATSGGSHARQ